MVSRHGRFAQESNICSIAVAGLFEQFNTTKRMRIRVAIVEDSRGTRESLTEVLSRASGLTCVGSYANGEQALKGLPAEKPDVVLMDINATLARARTFSSQQIFLAAQRPADQLLPLFYASLFANILKTLWRSRSRLRSGGHSILVWWLLSLVNHSSSLYEVRYRLFASRRRRRGR